jgi:hypothetical protein
MLEYDLMQKESVQTHVDGMLAAQPAKDNGGDVD